MGSTRTYFRGGGSPQGVGSIGMALTFDAGGTAIATASFLHGIAKAVVALSTRIGGSRGRLPRGHRRVVLDKRTLILTAANVIMDIGHGR